jgi:iron-sulfur cluster assembly accessory protein
MADIITITEPARKYISQIFKTNPDTALVVGFDNRGCSGHKYTFYLCKTDEIPADVDFVEVQDGRVVIDPTSVMGLLGATLDLHVEDFGEQLIWDNPSAVSSCGCGDSFQLPGEEACH